MATAIGAALLATGAVRVTRTLLGANPDDIIIHRRTGEELLDSWWYKEVDKGKHKVQRKWLHNYKLLVTCNPQSPCPAFPLLQSQPLAKLFISLTVLQATKHWAGLATRLATASIHGAKPMVHLTVMTAEHVQGLPGGGVVWDGRGGMWGIVTGVLQVWPQPLEQHFWPPVQSESPEHSSEQIPTTSSSTGGQENCSTTGSTRK